MFDRRQIVQCFDTFEVFRIESTHLPIYQAGDLDAPTLMILNHNVGRTEVAMNENDSLFSRWEGLAAKELAINCLLVASRAVHEVPQTFTRVDRSSSCASVSTGVFTTLSSHASEHGSEFEWNFAELQKHFVQVTAKGIFLRLLETLPDSFKIDARDKTHEHVPDLTDGKDPVRFWCKKIRRFCF